MMKEAEYFQTYKQLLFAIAYRTLGSATEAEDIVQETFADLLQARPQVDKMKAYLCKIVYNKCKDRMRAAAKERLAYVGPWLPEPLLTDPSELYLHRESLAIAYLLMLQQLSETERTVFILREAGEFSYSDIAYVVEKTEANCRQIYRRAKKALENHELRPEAEAARAKALIESFVHALQNGDLEKLLGLLSDDVIFAADSGGQQQGSLVPVRTSERVASFLMKTSSLIPSEMRTEFKRVNGGWGLVLSTGSGILYVFSFQLRTNRIQRIYVTANPDKLTFIGRQISLEIDSAMP
jgi:RNA polymerase sigma-70 factor (ECF subfamily)